MPYQLLLILNDTGVHPRRFQQFSVMYRTNFSALKVTRGKNLAKTFKVLITHVHEIGSKFDGDSNNTLPLA